MLNTESTKNNKVAIILATYNPNMLYLKQQLVSIRDQTFKDYHLYVFDDDSIKSNFKYIKNLLKILLLIFEVIHFPWSP